MLSPQPKLIYLAQSQLHKVQFYLNYRIDCVYGVTLENKMFEVWIFGKEYMIYKI